MSKIMAEQVGFSKNTEELIGQYLENISTQHDKLARRRVFNDFYKVEKKDLLAANESTYKHYCAVLKERVYRGEIQQLTSIKEIKFLNDLLSDIKVETEFRNYIRKTLDYFEKKN